MTPTERTVHSYLSNHIGPLGDVQLDVTTPLITGRVLDSVSTLKLIAYLEGEFDVEFDAHELDPDYLDTIALIAGLIDQKRAA